MQICYNAKKKLTPIHRFSAQIRGQNGFNLTTKTKQYRNHGLTIRNIRYFAQGREAREF